MSLEYTGLPESARAVETISSVNGLLLGRGVDVTSSQGVKEDWEGKSGTRYNVSLVLV